jgi:hypothetical protein
MEMVVVVAIIGLIAGISLPSITAGIDSVRLTTSTGLIASFLNGAVNRAERHERPVEVVISAKDSTLSMYSDEPGFVRELKLPDGIRIEAVLPEVPGARDGGQRLIFMPGGTVPGIGVQIVNRHSTRRIVRLDPMTGFPRVERVTNKQ